MVKNDFATTEEWLNAHQPKNEPEIDEDIEEQYAVYCDYQYDYLKESGVPLANVLASFLSFVRRLSPEQIYKEKADEVIAMWEDYSHDKDFFYPTFEEYLMAFDEEEEGYPTDKFGGVFGECYDYDDYENYNGSGSNT